MLGKSLHLNRLINEKSPYLQQHARNPVDWYPWDNEAFEKAKKENKPIFLSIGYSTCHWCHVMAHESFEDEDVARMMNETFVNIKVDREERPEIDQFYMTVCQMMTGHGGWPLTIIMTPDKKPFYAGTYYPKESRFGRIGLTDLIPRLKWAWEEKRQDIITSADTIMETVKETFNEPSDGSDLGEVDLKVAFRHLQERFDEEYGGFGGAPKFPMPHNLMFLLRYWKRYNDKQALGMVDKTLREMRSSGLYDHVGFGFHRYSTDEQWLVPHFEKMLYDQALLAFVYTEAFQATGALEYRETAGEIIEYVLRELRSPQGGFYSAQDADSEGEEGKYYLWTLKEFRNALFDEDVRILERIFDIKEEGNFKDETSTRPTGKNIIHLRRPLDQLSVELSIPQPELMETIEEARRKLKAARDLRQPLHRDEKILNDWNSLMIAALAKTGAALGERRYIDAAEEAVRYLLASMRIGPGKLLHAFRDGSAVTATLDDYAFLTFALIELYEATFATNYLSLALELNGEMIEKFWDDKNGAMFLTASDNRDLPVRAREIYDGALPSGNSMAMWNMLRLGRITGDTGLDEKAAGIARAVSLRVRQLPTAHTMLMVALDFAVGPSYKVVVVGSSQAEETKRLINPLREKFIPNAMVVQRPMEQKNPEIDRISPSVKELSLQDGEPTAYICSDVSCIAPTRDSVVLVNMLNYERREAAKQK